MKQNEVREWFSENKKRVAIIAGATALLLGSAGVGCWYLASDLNTTPTVEAKAKIPSIKTVKKEDIKIDYLKYVKGLKDWTVQVGQKVNFMTDVTWDKEQISMVTVDSTKVDLAKEGNYSLIYTVKVKDSKEADLKITKRVTVQVVSQAKAEEAAKAGEEVVTDKGIQNKKEAKPSSINDDGVTAKKVDKPNNGGNSNSNNGNGNNKPSNPNNGNGGGNNGNNKPAETPKPNPPKDENKVCSHNWVQQTKTVNHPAAPAKTHTEDKGHYETVVDVPESQVWVSNIIRYEGCRLCGWACPNNDTASDEAFGHIASVHNWDSQAGWKVCQRDDGHYETIPAQTHQEWIPNIVTITDEPAKDAWSETVPDGQKCTKCGVRG